jgi:thiol-disulfide isomerase/thioredoxin/tetratricopeptide (TPR) repeat protein
MSGNGYSLFGRFRFVAAKEWFFVLLCVACCVSCFAHSRQSPTETKARVSFKKAAEAAKTGDYSTASAAYREAIESKPDFVLAHAEYASTVYSAHGSEKSQASAELDAQYKKWAKQFPRSAVVEWGWGNAAGLRDDEDKKKAHMRRALELDPNFALAYKALGSLARAHSDFPVCREMYRKALEKDPDPDDAGTAMDLAVCIKPEGSTAYRAYLSKTAEDFSGTTIGLSALLRLSEGVKDSERLEVLERGHTESYSRVSIYEELIAALFKEYMNIDVLKASAVAEEGARRWPDSSQWPEAAEFCRSLAGARRLLDAGKSVEAAAAADKLTPPPLGADRGWQEPLVILRGEATSAAYGPEMAYQKLLPMVAEMPAPRLRTELTDLGRKAGRSTSDIDRDVYQALVKNAQSVEDFDLPGFVSGRSGKLSTYRGRVVLVNFWFPSCPPCREEFHRLQKIADGSAGNLIVLAINLAPEQDKLVPLALKDEAVTFMALKAPLPEELMKTYAITGTPTNILIDRNGREVLRPQLLNDEEEEALAYQVKLLTEYAGATGL